MKITAQQPMSRLFKALTYLWFSFSVAVFAQDSPQEVVTIAIAAPMSGTSVSIGSQFKAGVLAAIELETDGVLLGRNISISEYDDRCRPNIAESIAEEIASVGPALVIGHSCSSATLAALPIYDASHLLQITPASTAPEITEQGINTVFRMLGRDDQQGELAANYILEHFPDARIGILRFPSQYSQAATTVAIEQLQARGGNIVHTASANGSATSYLQQVKDMMAAQVDVVYAVGGVLDIGVFARQASMVQAGFHLVSADSLISAAFPAIAGSGAEEVMFTFPAEAHSLIDHTTFATIENAINHHGNVEARGYALLSYAAIQVWIHGVKRAGSFDTSDVADAIRSGPIPTILGDVTFNEKGDITTATPNFLWHVWRNGESHVIE